MQKITPFLWFDKEAEEAARFYISIFKNAKIGHISRYGDAGPGPSNPLVGLVPTERSLAGAGMGLWLIHQLDIDVALFFASGGFTLRLRGGQFPPSTSDW